MKKAMIIVLSVFMVVSVNSQTKEVPSRLNLDFEQVENGNPIGMLTFGNSEYKTYLDSVNVKSGKYAVVIEYKGNSPEGIFHWG